MRTDGLIAFRNGRQMDVHFILGQHTESRIRFGNNADLDLRRFKVNGEYCRQARDSQLDSLFFAVLGFLLQLLLQIAVRFGLFDTHRDGLEATIVTSRIGFIDARTFVVVVRDQDHAASQRTHLGILRVHLVDVCNSAAQYVDGNFSTKLVQPIGRLVTSPLHLGTAVSCEIKCKFVINLQVKRGFQ